MEVSTRKSVHRAAITLFALAILLCQAQLFLSAGRLRDPVSLCLDGIYADWDDGRLAVLKPPPPDVAKLGIQMRDVLVALEDSEGTIRPMRSPVELSDARKKIGFGKPFALHLLRPGTDGKLDARRIPLPAVLPPAKPSLGGIAGLLPQILLGLLCVATGLFLGYARPGDSSAFNASLLFLSVAVLPWGSITGQFPPVLRELALAVWIFPFSFATALFMRFFLLFPAPSPLERRMPWLKGAGLAFGLVFSLWNYSWHYFFLNFPQAFKSYFLPIRWLDYTLDVLYVACFILGLVSLVLNTLHAEGVDERRRGRLLLCGAAGILPWLAVYIETVTLGLIAFPIWVRYMNLCFMALFPIAFAYAVVRHRVFGIRVILRRGLRFAFLSKGFLAAEGVVLFLALYFGAMPLLGGALRGTSPTLLALGTAAIAALTVFGLWRLNRTVMPRIERHFFREAYDARTILTDLARSVRKLSASPEALFSTVTSTLIKSLHPGRAAIYLRGSEVLRMPASDPAHRALGKGKAKEHPEDFFCLWTSGAGWSSADCADAEASLATLSGDSAVARRLAEFAGRDVPESLEVCPGEGRGWASTVLRFGSGEDIRFVRDSGFCLLVPLSSREDLLGFIALGEKLSEEPYGREDKELLLAVGQQMADNLEYADLLREGQEQAILRREVEIAREVQERLLVQTPVPFPRLDYAGACRPARFVGGDYYDYIRSSESHLGFALGDVSGKGVSAALLMAGLQAALRVRADIHGGALERVFSEINRHMCESTDDGRFATLFYGIFDPASLRMDFVNAGHNPPILLRSGSGDVEHLGSTGPILGLEPGSRYARGTVALHPGDILVLFSDGVTEAMDEGEEFYGEERLEEFVRSLSGASATAMRDAIFADVDRFAGERSQNDDITLVVIRVTADEPVRLSVLDSSPEASGKPSSAPGA